MWEKLITPTLYRKMRETDGQTDGKTGLILMPTDYRHGAIKKTVTLLTSVHKFGDARLKKQNFTTQPKKSLSWLMNLVATNVPESVINSPDADRDVC